jgi:hypothetical protein
MTTITPVPTPNRAWQHLTRRVPLRQVPCARNLALLVIVGLSGCWTGFEL